MKTIIAIFAFALTSLAPNTAFAQVQKSLIKSFNLNGARTVALNLRGAVEVRTSENAALRIQTDIDLKNGNQALFDAFLTKKRYDVQTKNNGLEFSVTPNEMQPVKFGGQELQEKVTYIVYLPEGVKIVNTVAVQ